MNVKAIYAGALALFAGNALSSLLGLLREILSAAYYGADVDMDAFLFANTIPSILLAVIGGLFTAGFIPLFIRRHVEHGADEASRMYSNTLNWLLAMMLLMMGICYAFSDAFASLFATGEESRILIRKLLWILVPTIFFFGLSYMQTAVLNSQNRFKIAAFVPAANNIVLIALMIAFHERLGIYSVAWGFMLGTVVQVVIQWPAMRRLGIRYRFHWDGKADYLRKLVQMSLPIIGLVVIDQCLLLVTRYFSSSLDAGSASAINYASRILTLPVTLFGTALVSASYPSAVRAQAEKDAGGYNAVVQSCVKSLLLILVPASVLIALLAPSIIRLLFERGAFDAGATRMTAAALIVMSVGIVALPLRDLLGKLFFGRENFRVPLLATVLYLAVFLGSCLLLVPAIGYLGIPAASAAAWLLHAIFLIAAYKRTDRQARLGFSGTFVAKVLAATVAASALSRYLYGIVLPAGAERLPEAGAAALSAAAFAVVYLAAVKLLRIEEVDALVRRLNARFAFGRKGRAVANKA